MAVKEGSCEMAVKEGSYTWSIENELFNKMVNAKHGEEFCSDIFVIEDLRWQINICPYGDQPKDMGSFQVYLELITLPELWSHVIVNRTIDSPQTQSSQTCTSTYAGHGSSQGWAINTLTLKEIIESELSKIVICVRIRILRIILKQHKSVAFHYKFKYQKCAKLKWKLSKQTLSIARKANNRKRIESAIFNHLWCITLWPNGKTHSTNGHCFMGLQLCAFPLNVSAVKVQWNLSIKELNFNKTQTVKYKVLKGAVLMNICTFGQFQKCEFVTIEICALILKEYDKNNAQIEIFDSESKWNQINHSKTKRISESEQKQSLFEMKLNALSANIQRLSVAKDKEIHSLKIELMNKAKQISKHEQILQESITKNALFFKEISQKMESFSRFISENMSEMEKNINILQKNNESILREINAVKQGRNNNGQCSSLDKSSVSSGNVSNDLQKLRTFIENELGMAQYFEIILDAGFEDMQSFNDVTNEDLKEMNVKIAHRKKILKAIHE